jgi:hypothetical protein
MVGPAAQYNWLGTIGIQSLHKGSFLLCFNVVSEMVVVKCQFIGKQPLVFNFNGGSFFIYVLMLLMDCWWLNVTL